MYAEDPNLRYPVRLFAHGESYRLFGLLELDRHLFGVEQPGGLFLFGTDTIGRDVYSRTIHAARVSLFIGLAGVALTFVIGVTLGGISGYFGGRADMLIQRLIEFLMSLPTIPLWLALSAAMPRDWPILRIYFGIVIVLSLVSWGRLARVVRGKLLELRELDFVTAARLAGMKESRIIRAHLLPNFAGYLIVSVSLDIPHMILAETALSFLGLGLRSPAVSWGVLLQDAQKLRSVAAFPWLMIPALFVVRRGARLQLPGRRSARRGRSVQVARRPEYWLQSINTAMLRRDEDHHRSARFRAWHDPARAPSGVPGGAPPRSARAVCGAAASGPLPDRRARVAGAPPVSRRHSSDHR